MLALLALVIHTGGFVIVLIALASIAALTVVIERLWRLLPLSSRFAHTRAHFHEILLKGGGELARRQIGDDDALGRVYQAGLAAEGEGSEGIRAAALAAAQGEVPALERGLGIVLAVTQVCPLLGLLGTAAGLVQAFQAASLAEHVTLKVVAGGVAQALTATVAGLLVAIPAFLAYGALSGLCGRLADELEHGAAELPSLIRRDV